MHAHVVHLDLLRGKKKGEEEGDNATYKLKFGGWGGGVREKKKRQEAKAQVQRRGATAACEDIYALFVAMGVCGIHIEEDRVEGF